MHIVGCSCNVCFADFAICHDVFLFDFGFDDLPSLVFQEGNGHPLREFSCKRVPHVDHGLQIVRQHQNRFTAKGSVPSKKHLNNRKLLTAVERRNWVV